MSVGFSFSFGWMLILVGVLLGAGIGLFFHRDRWLGGYESFERRLLRLGHIACFGMGFLNIFCGLSLRSMPVNPYYGEIAVACLFVAGITMPTICIATVFWRAVRHAFPIPVFATVVGVLAMLLSLSTVKFPEMLLEKRQATIEQPRNAERAEFTGRRYPEPQPVFGI